VQPPHKTHKVRAALSRLKSAFTLIDLLMVIAIIAILPAEGRFSLVPLEQLCQQNRHQSCVPPAQRPQYNSYWKSQL
jgi:Tfp pilus assembly protein FimT